MRITNTMLVNNMINYMGNNLSRMEKYQRQMATGKKIDVPSDDPIVATRALKFRTDIAEIEQYQSNVKDAQSWMDITENTVGSMGEILQRVRELAVQGSNGGTISPGDSQKIAQEVLQLKNQVIQLANTTYSGRYIFSGYQTDKPLMDTATGQFNISVSNSEQIKFQVGVSDYINVNVCGGDLFNGGANATAATGAAQTGSTSITFPVNITSGVNDILNLTVNGQTVNATIPAGSYADAAALGPAVQTAINSALTVPNSVNVSFIGSNMKITSTDLNAATSSVTINTGASTAGTVLGLNPSNASPVSGPCAIIKDLEDLYTNLMNGNATAVSSLLGNIDDDINNLLRVRADIGARQNRMDLTTNRLDNDDMNFTKLMSNNEEVDMAETIMNLQNEENVYKASLSGGARIIQPSLVDFLR